MSEALRVDLREATMTESARLRERGDQLFLVMDTPPPVRSLLRVTLGEERKAFEVARVIEVVDEGEPDRGCYGQWVDVARLGEQSRVGSEHLEPGISGGAGVPAPVVIMNTSEMMLAEAGEDDDVVLTRSDRFGGNEVAEPSESTESSESSESESSESESGPSGEAGEGEAASESTESESSESSEETPPEA